MSTDRHPDVVLDAVVTAAVEATGAGRGWLFAFDGGDLQVVACHLPGGGDGPASIALGTVGPATAGWAGWVRETGQPVAVVPEAADRRFSGDLVVGAGARPTALLCFPCRHHGVVVGTLQLVDKAAGAPFSVDDVEVVGLLAEIAGVAIAEVGTSVGEPVPPSGVLGRELQVLAARNPGRYGAVAVVASELLAHH